jgi:SM-20-related protein
LTLIADDLRWPTAPVFERVADALATSGWGVLDAALPEALASSLIERARSLESYQRAAVGRRERRQRNRFVRRDEVAWMSGAHPAEADWLNWMGQLREHLNRTLMIGLHQYEGHFAHYAPGAFYRRHVDAFRGEANRVLSVVAYLNADWLPGDGGELVLYDEGGSELGRFPPQLGTLAVFLSEQFPHEVLAARRDRFSIAGWFRRRSEGVEGLNLVGMAPTADAGL